MDNIFSIKRGSLVVFEGLDKAGKSTQVDRFKALAWEHPAPQFAHMPSGLTSLTGAVYELLENVKPESQLARQLLHLACHAENVPEIIRQRQDSAVILDRFWWSTVAYGWHGGRIGESGLEWSAFMNLVDAIWGQLAPDLVFLFINAYDDDSNNNDQVEQGYRALAKEFEERTVLVPRLAKEQTTRFIVDELTRRGIAA
ncbi:dTMP kinase [Pseudarthrobacter sp. NPDC092439]|uniref:dTMP kinase n=1 Tax=unclassified Pseudarthrobacter TaxID=2647000 RepID=UPI003826E644